MRECEGVHECVCVCVCVYVSDRGGSPMVALEKKSCHPRIITE